MERFGSGLYAHAHAAALFRFLRISPTPPRAHTPPPPRCSAHRQHSGRGLRRIFVAWRFMPLRLCAGSTTCYYISPAWNNSSSRFLGSIFTHGIPWVVYGSVQPSSMDLVSPLPSSLWTSIHALQQPPYAATCYCTASCHHDWIDTTTRTQNCAHLPRFHLSCTRASGRQLTDRLQGSPSPPPPTPTSPGRRHFPTWDTYTNIPKFGYAT